MHTNSKLVMHSDAEMVCRCKCRVREGLPWYRSAASLMYTHITRLQARAGRLDRANHARHATIVWSNTWSKVPGTLD